MPLAWIGLGSNLANDSGDSRQILREAVQTLRQLGTLQVSALYASAPMGPQDQPDYLNAVVCVDTELLPYALLAYLQAMEQAAGRQRLRRWGERTLDLDILLMQGVQMDAPQLVIPHAGLMQRSFVVQPMLEVQADLQLDGVYLRDLAVAQAADGIRLVARGDWANAPLLD